MELGLESTCPGLPWATRPPPGLEGDQFKPNRVVQSEGPGSEDEGECSSPVSQEHDPTGCHPVPRNDELGLRNTTPHS